jgi:tetratricopeptide (TPR) repeat protein
MRRLLVACLAGTFLTLSLPLGAQQKAPRRPKLEQGADTNSWHAYYQLGLTSLQKRPQLAGDAFYWAARINPIAPEPQFAQWVAYWKARPDRFFDYWFMNKKFVIQAKETKQIDSLRYSAMLKNPMMFQGLWLRIFDDYMGIQSSLDPATQGFLAYSRGDHQRAVDRFGAAMRENKKRQGLRFDRALAFAQLAEYDSATAELQKLIEDKTKKDEEELVRFYESNAMYEYSIGMLQYAKGDVEAAKAAFGRALTENLAFAMAHYQLAELALAARDSATALQELDQAVQLDSTYVGSRYVYGLALLVQGRTADAERHLRKAIALEPYFSAAYFPLAYILEFEGKNAEAAEMYEAFALRAPQFDSERVGIARTKAAALRATASTGGGAAP